MSNITKSEFASDANAMLAMQNHASEAAKLLKALASDKRLLVLCQLAQGEFSVGALVETLNMGQSSLSQHLAVLRSENLVQTRREAQTIYYRLSDGPVQQVMQTLYQIYCSP